MPVSSERLSGCALVTGAGSGIGRAVAIALSTAGTSTLYLTDISSKGLEATATAINELSSSQIAIHLIPGDISSPSFVEDLFSQIPSLQYAVNCAGILGPITATHELPLEALDAVTNTNYRGLFLCEAAEIRLMLKNPLQPYTMARTPSTAVTRGQRGAIVNIASQLALVGKASTAAYTASKAAILALTRSDACDYSVPGREIRINAVCPGVVRSAMTSNADGVVNKELVNAVSRAPMGRVGEPEEIADAVVWLCGGESSFVTGTAIVVDGGYVVV